MTKGREIPFNQVSDQDASTAVFTENDQSVIESADHPGSNAIEMSSQHQQMQQNSPHHAPSGYPHHLLHRHYLNHTQGAQMPQQAHQAYSQVVPRYNNSMYTIPSVYPSPQYPPQTPHAPVQQPTHIQQESHHQAQPSHQHVPLAYSPHLHTAYHPAPLPQAPTQAFAPMHHQQVQPEGTFEAYLDPQPIAQPTANPISVFCPHCKQHGLTKVKSAPILLAVILLLLILGPMLGGILALILYKTGVLTTYVHSCGRCGQRLSKRCSWRNKTPRPTVRLAVAGWVN